MDSEKAFIGAGTVAESSARSMTESVADWPRHWLAQVLTKSSTMFLPIWTESMLVSALSFVSQLV